MATGQEMNEQLEFDEHIRDKVDKEDTNALVFWTAKELYFLNKKVNKLPCQAEDNPPCAQDKSSRTKHIAIGAGTASGGLLITYGILKVILSHFGVTI
jgi:hypothetical protein